MEATRHFQRISIKKEQDLFKAADLLDKWIDDLLLNGIIVLKDDPEKINEIATRMVDLGAAGIARKLRTIPEKIKEKEDWTEYVILQLAAFILFINALKVTEKKDDAEKEDLLSFAGIPFKSSDFLEDSALADEWLYLGNRTEKEEKLLIRRNWFYGIHSKQTVLFLEFQFNRFAKFKSFKPGIIYRSLVKFYPSKILQRVKDISSEQIVRPDFEINNILSVHRMLDHYCELNLLNPFVRHACYFLQQLRFYKSTNQWFITDESQQLVLLDHNDSDISKILSFAAIPDIVFVAEYFENRIRIVAVVDRGKVMEI